MKILLIEDDPNKLRQLSEFVRDVAPGVDLIERRSYQSGLLEAVTSRPEVLLLDMTIPTYDISPTEQGGRPRPFGGREILADLLRKGIPTRAIVVTQFESFGDGEDAVSLEELTRELRQQFGAVFVGTVYYQAADSRWRQKLSRALLKAGVIREGQ